MIRQTMVPPVAGPGNEAGQRKFLETLSESLQGVMQPHPSTPPEGGALEVRAFGPLVFVRYEGNASNVTLPFQPDSDMPLACDMGNGMIDASDRILMFDFEGPKIAWGWCISSGTPAGRFQ